MYEAQHTHKSISNQANFCWSMRQIYMTICLLFHPHAKVPMWIPIEIAE